MTSKRLFFNCMKEDLRHKIWMIALSVLGNFLALPIAYLIAFDKTRYNTEFPITDPQLNAEFIADIMSFFAAYVTALGGIIAIVGALIVGLFSFRYVFHKNMIDTWHSLPVKRNTLFGACYLNGFLIWFVPYLFTILLTICLAAGEIYRRGGIETVGTLFRVTFTSTAAIIVSFLLVYNLILVAVMLSGNLLNTLVSAGVLGISVLSVYGMIYAFFELYMDTFYSLGISLKNAIYASPFASAVCVLYDRCHLEQAEFMVELCINLLIALIIGMAAWLLYKRRASELAGQGLKNRIMSLLMKLIVSICAGMSGWMFFVIITNREQSLIWGIFGNILSSVLCFGILDIIFSMDFKAFAAHKLWMLLSVAISVLLCCSFFGDWYGYDNYLPKETEISHMAIYCDQHTNRSKHYNGDMTPLDDMQLQDAQLIYDFLQAAVKNVDSDKKQQYFSSGNNYDSFLVKVSLTNGRSYEREYRLFVEDKAVVLPLLTQKEYVDWQYKIRKTDFEDCSSMVLFGKSNNGSTSKEETEDKDMIRSICLAFNQDLEENPENVVLGQGRLLLRIELRMPKRVDMIRLDIYESMTHTLEALRSAGYEKYTKPMEASDVDYISLEFEKYYERYETDTAVADTKEVQQEQSRQITVTDAREIEDLLKLLHYRRPLHDYSVFRKNFISGIVIVDKEGVEHMAYIKEGELPEKYIKRFYEP